MYLTPHIRCVRRGGASSLVGGVLRAIEAVLRTRHSDSPSRSDWPPAQLHAEPRSAKGSACTSPVAQPLRLCTCSPPVVCPEVRVVTGDGIASSVAPGRPNGVPMMASEHYMAAMRSAGDYAITCRVRQAAQASSAAGIVCIPTFSRTRPAPENYEDLPYLGAHGAEVPFVFGDSLSSRLMVSAHLGVDGLLLAQLCAQEIRPAPVAYGDAMAQALPMRGSRRTLVAALLARSVAELVPGDDEQTMAWHWHCRA